MKVQVIKKEIPTEISAEGGASIMIVNRETVELETSIDEAKDALIVMGDKLLIKGIFVGLFKSMVKGIERDGHARQLGDFLTLYPVSTGEFDLDRGWDPTVNDVRIRVRLLNEMELDISQWEFEDVTPGRQSFSLGSILAGDVTGVVASNTAIEINGKNLPLAGAIRVEWALEDGTKSGTVAAAKITSSATRIDLAADTLAEIASATYDGKKVIFTVRGNYAKASISALFKYVVPPTPSVTSVQGVGCVNGEIKRGTKFTVKGLNLDKLDLTQSHEFQYKVGGETRLGTIAGEEFTTVTATELISDIALPDEADIGSTVTLTLFFTGYPEAEGTATVVAA